MKNEMIDLYFKLPGQFITDNDLAKIYKIYENKIVVIKDGVGTGKTLSLIHI